MLRTEEEARKCWCPFARYTSVRGQGINRWTDDGDTNLSPNATKCIASECMAWRWENRGIEIAVPAGAEFPETGYVKKRGLITSPGTPDAKAYDVYALGFTSSGSHSPAVFGRCGLAGQ